MSVITGPRERASTLSKSSCRRRREAGPGSGVLVFVGLLAVGCTLTASEYEPSAVGSPETANGSLGGSEAPAAPPPESPPAGNAASPSPVADDSEQGESPVDLSPTDMGGEGAGGVLSGTSGTEPGQDAGLSDAGTGDAGDAAPAGFDASAAPPGEPDAATPSSRPDASASSPGEPDASAAPPRAPCPGLVYAGSCYQFFAEQLPWNVAEERCVALGGHLASVESWQEDAFLASWPALVGISFGDGSGLWLGGTDARQDWDFRWADDRTLSFRGWAPNQPDDGQGVDCIEKRNDATQRWYDRRCTDAERYVCERPE